MKRIKTGVVGGGALGQHHLRWYSQLADSELVGFYDIDQQSSRKHASEHNTKAFESLEQLADNVEAVSIAVPTTSHFDTASFLIERGIHCLIEKPISTTVEQGTKLGRLADKSGVKVTVGQIERFNPAVISLKKATVEPSFIEAHRLAAFDPRGTDVAVVLDLMIHDIDLCLMLIGSKVADIHASAVAVISDNTDIANARLTFENGAVANLTASRISLNAMRKLRIFQKSGYFSLDLAKKQADIYRLASKDEKTEGLRLPLGKSGREISYTKKSDNGEDMLGSEISSLLKCIIDDSRPAVTVDEAVEALRVALEIERIGRESSNRMIQASSV